MSEHQASRSPRDTKPAGMRLALSGAIVIVVFGAYLVVQAFKRAPMDSPVWLGVILGAVMLAYGIYRRVRGPGALDFPEEGGTNADNK